MNRSRKVVVSNDFPRLPSKQPYINPAESNMGIQMHVGMAQDPRLQNKMGAKMSGLFNGGKYMNLAMGDYSDYMDSINKSDIPWPRDHSMVPPPYRCNGNCRNGKCPNCTPRGTAYYQNKYAADGIKQINKEYMDVMRNAKPLNRSLNPTELNVGYPGNHAGRVDINIASALQPCSDDFSCISRYQYQPPHILQRSQHYQSLNDLPQRTHFNFYYDDVKNMRLNYL